MKKRFCIVVSSPMTAKAFLRDQLAVLSGLHELHVVANADDEGAFLGQMGVRASFSRAGIERRISPFRDFAALLALLRIFGSRRIEVVHSVTPKAGLLAMTAAFGAGVPCRIHTFTGQVWANKKGVARWVLKNMDRIISLLATHILVDSASQRDFLAASGVVCGKKAVVLGHGSISGVDIDRFRPDAGMRAEVRRELGTGEGDILFLYLGRLNKDKGIPELLGAFERVHKHFPQARLLLVGPDEEGLDAAIPSSNAFLRVGYTATPERYMAACDVFVLPSHREGFGSTVIEAAACGVPCIASRIYGLTDAVVEGETGLLHRPQDSADLANAMLVLAADPEKRHSMGEQARKRAVQDFSMDVVTGNTMDFYFAALDPQKRSE